jgi:zinc transporter ZupT
MAVLYLGTLLGVQIGTYLNAATLAISLGLVLGFMFYTTLQKALKNYKDENI